MNMYEQPVNLLFDNANGRAALKRYGAMGTKQEIHMDYRPSPKTIRT